MVFHGGYHGGVLYFVSGGSPVNMPYEYVVAPYNDIEGTRELIVPRTPYIVAYTVIGAQVMILSVIHGSRRWPDRL